MVEYRKDGDAWAQLPEYIWNDVKEVGTNTIPFFSDKNMTVKEASDYTGSAINLFLMVDGTVRGA